MDATDPLRSKLSEAEQIMSEGISFLCAGREKLFQVKELYEDLANQTTNEKIKSLLRDRRIKGRIDRILSGYEYFDELDAKGNKTGNLEVSTIAHLRGVRHASVNVLCFNQQGQALLQLRAPTVPVFPGRWTFSASGHVKSGQLPKEAAIEEMREELSSSVTPEEEANLPDSMKALLEVDDNRVKWLCFHPKKEKLLTVGRENGYDGYLYSVELAYLDNTEKKHLKGVVNQNLGQQANFGIARVFSEFYESANTLLLFTYDQQQRDKLNQVIEAIENETGIPRGMLTDNIEKKSLYIYHFDEDEEPLVEEIIELKRKKGKPIGAGLTSGFQWVDFDQTVKEFNERPEGYTDAFVPFLSEETIVDEIKRLQIGR